MILIVDRDDRDAYASDLEKMFAHRKHVFIDQLGWRISVSGERESDCYDCPETIYLLAKDDPWGDVLASARLLPTEHPHLMSDVFRDSCVGELPRGRNIWEASRFCTNPQVRSYRVRLQLLWQIIAGIMETALLFDKEYVTFTANRALLPLVLKCGWEATTLGPTRRDSGDEVTPVVARITPSGLRTLRRNFCLQAPLVRFLAASPTAIAA